MTLILAWMLASLLGASWWVYPALFVLWLVHCAAHGMLD